MVNGAGGFLGPDLSDYGASHSADDIRNAIVSADQETGSPQRLGQSNNQGWATNFWISEE